MNFRRMIRKILIFLQFPLTYIVISYIALFIVFVMVVNDSHTISFSNLSSKNLLISPISIDAHNFYDNNIQDFDSDLVYIKGGNYISLSALNVSNL